MTEFRKQSRPWPLKALLILTLLVLSGALIVYYSTRSANQAWKEHQAALEAQGESFNWSDFVAPKIPDKDNLVKAPIMQGRKALYALLPENGLQGWKSPDQNGGFRTCQAFPFNRAYDPYTTGKPLSRTEALAALGAFYDTRRTGLETALKASQLKGFWKPLSSPDSDPSPRRILARVFRMPALYHLAIDDPDTAITYLRACCQLSESRFSDFTNRIDHLVRMSISMMALDIIWHGLKEERWQESHLKEIETQLQQLQRQESSTIQSLRTERAQLIWLITEHGDHHDVAEWLSPYTNLPTKIALHTFPGTQVPHYLVRASENYQNAIRILEIADQPLQTEAWKQFQQKLEAEEAKIFDGKSDQASLLWVITEQSFGRTLSIDRRAQTYIDLARIAVAAERFKLALGKYPSSLDKLAPHYLKAIPTDRISGAAFHYGLGEDDKPRIYSNGWDEDDDQGHVTKDHWIGDWVWQYTYSNFAPDDYERHHLQE